MDRSLIILSCITLIALAARDAPAKDLGDEIKAGKIQRTEREMGPFRIEGRDFTVVIKDLKYPGATMGFDETVESFSIVDQDGRVHYEKSFPLEYDEAGFGESWGMGGSALDSRGLKGFRNESGKLVELPQKDVPGAGLVLYYGFTPSSPGSGGSCQVFAMREGKLLPLFLPLHVYGTNYELEPGSSPNSRRLFENDTMRFGEWTGWFEVVVPLRVFDNLKVVPLHYSVASGYYACEVVVDRSPSAEDTFVRLFDYPNGSSTPRHIIIKKETRVEFVFAYTKVAIKQGIYGCSISIDQMPWLMVRIDGKEGFVRDAEDLRALGLRQAG